MEEVFGDEWELWLEFGVAERKLQNESDMMGRMIRITLFHIGKLRIISAIFHCLKIGLSEDR